MSDAGAAASATTPREGAQASGPLIFATGITKNFYDVDREIRVLQDLSLTVQPGELIAVVGQSGTGKSTLLHILGSLERPSSGKVLFEGQDLFALDERALAEFLNRKLGFVFQFHYLLADFSALENVMMPALIARLSDSEARQRAENVLDVVGLKDKLHRRPAELSGGEQQRVAVARAVVLGPKLVLADEPTGNLDPQTAEEVNQVFQRLNRDLNVTLVVATHNERLSRSMSRTLRLSDGKLHEEKRAGARTHRTNVSAWCPLKKSGAFPNATPAGKNLSVTPSRRYANLSRLFQFDRAASCLSNRHDCLLRGSDWLAWSPLRGGW